MRVITAYLAFVSVLAVGVGALILTYVVAVAVDYHRGERVGWDMYSAEVLNVVLAPLNVIAHACSAPVEAAEYPWTQKIVVNRTLLLHEARQGQAFIRPVSRWSSHETLGSWQAARVKWFGEGDTPTAIATAVFPVAGGAALDSKVQALLVCSMQETAECPRHRSPWAGAVRVIVVLEGELEIALESDQPPRIVRADDEEAFVFDPTRYHSMRGRAVFILAELQRKMQYPLAARGLDAAYRHLSPRLN